MPGAQRAHAPASRQKRGRLFNRLSWRRTGHDAVSLVSEGRNGFDFSRRMVDNAGMPHASDDPLGVPLRQLHGVGPERNAQLARLGLVKVGDLLLHRPRRHEDRRQFRPIAEMQRDEPALARGKIVACGVKWWRNRQKSVFELILDDGSARLHCRWWNLPYMQNYFQVGMEVLVFGKLNSLKPRAIDHPETETVENSDDPSIHLNRIAPVYPLTEGLPQRWLRALVWRVVAEYAPQVKESWPDLDLAGRPTRAEALRTLHFPAELAEIESARQRLALDEFIGLQREIRRRRQNLISHGSGQPCPGDNRLMKPFLAALGFALTGAQTKVLREIRHDLGADVPMRRLLQGDVGAGKTVVAACSALMAIESGRHAALMAPTEILAEQHRETFQRWFTPLGIPVDLRTGSHKPTAGSPTAPSLIIGTHALLEADFAPNNLGLVIIDEQHKFGVAQREQLLRKGAYPHLLVMTATPIPRTLGLTLYGDLDISVIDQLPGMRGRVKTHVRDPGQLAKVWRFIRQKLAEGRQAYVVYPRVEEGEPGGIKAVKLEWENVRKELAPFEVGLLHGRVKSDERARIMTDFRAARLPVLVATSIIEVGVDVPNATVMLIENAEQFGLAQLHQLRGRIGRGAHESHCILVAAAKTETARRRLEILAATTDGFRIAEADMQLRGPGELLGRDQSGRTTFRFGNLLEDGQLIDEARRLVLSSRPTAEIRDSSHNR